MTPFNHQKKPQCLFCLANNCSVKHLLFECPSCRGLSARPKIVESCDRALRACTSEPALAQSLSHKIQQLWDARNYSSLFLFMMGLHETDFDERRDCWQTIIKNTADSLHSLKADWIAQKNSARLLRQQSCLKAAA